MRGPQIVFLGPTLSRQEAQALAPDAIILPPAKMGDVLGASLRFSPHAIGLIDGTFLSNMSVFHKELLYAMDQGIWLLGSSSMGALRAAECHPYGMIGVGQIYQDLVSGALEDDDEVALTHSDAEFEYRAQSDAMVTIRASLAAALDTELIDQDEFAILISCQKERWFPDRHLASVSDDAKQLGMDTRRVQALQSFLRTSSHDPKREDAIELLKRMVSLPQNAFPESDRPSTVMSGVFETTLARDVVVETKDGLPITFDRIRKYAAIHDPRFAGDMFSARSNMVLSTLSRWLGGMPSNDELAQARARIGEKVGYALNELDDWASSVDLRQPELENLVASEALVWRLVHSWLGRSRMGLITSPYLNVLRMGGRYEEAKQGAALNHSAAKGVNFSSAPSNRRLLASFEALGSWRVPANLEEYVKDNEFGSVADLLAFVSTSLKAHHALFGIGLVEGEVEGIAVDDGQEPFMTRGR